MIDLTNLEQIKKLDPKNVYGSTAMLVEQCQQILESYLDVVTYSQEYKTVKNIVICGMGGSGYGGHIALSLFKNQLKIPLYLNSDYHLPGFADKTTLVLLTSYSGSTEEVLSCAKEAVVKKTKITGFSSGGNLGEFLRKTYPGFTFDPKFNPSSQPRLGTGYIVLGTIALLRRLGVIDVSKDEIKLAIEVLRNAQRRIKKQAIEIAHKIYGSMPIFFAAEFLGGNAHIIRNQCNETAKSFSSFSELPELNHHLMEGLKNPPDKKVTVLFLTSNSYSNIIKKRIELTKEVVTKNNVRCIEYKAEGETPLSQVLTVLSFGGYLSLFLALLYQQDPSLIPWVDYFKEQLKK